MSLFNRLTAFVRPKPAPIPLTQAEKDQQALDQRKCPDCGSGHMIGGPRGGASQNMACATCQSEFCVINYMGHLSLLHRMGKLSRERASLYGIEIANA